MKPTIAFFSYSLVLAGCVTADDELSTAEVESEIRDISLAGPQDLLGVVNVNNNCTGELISSNTVLTAAHCVCNGGTCGATAEVWFRLEPSTGLHGLPGNHSLVGRVRAHPGYVSGGKTNDLATITFDASAPGYAAPFTVDSTMPSSGSAIMLAGYGYTGSSCSDTRPVYPYLFWDSTHFDRYAVYPNGQRMLQWDDERACKGDSGGAAIRENGTLNPTVLTGIIQGSDWAIPYGYIDVATATGSFYSWIKAAVCTSTSQNSCSGNGSLCDCTGSTSVIWRNSTWGDVAIWTMNGGSATSAPTVQPGIPLDWQIVGSGDFDGDRQADLLWRFNNALNTQAKIWRMVGTSHVSSTVLPDPGLSWSVEAVADFDGNGRADILWGNKDTGDHRLWSNGDANTSRKVSWQNAGGNVETWWKVKGAGDFNGDGKADIFWETDGGSTAIWLMNGSSWIGDSNYGMREDGYHFQGIGDFNGDARSDVLWRRDNGELRIWFNGGSSKLSGPSWHNQYVTQPGSLARPAPVDTNWYVDQIADFNHDGRDDLLWRVGTKTNPGTVMSIWYLDGTRYVGEVDPRMPGESTQHWFDPAWRTTGVSRQPNF